MRLSLLSLSLTLGCTLAGPAPDEGGRDLDPRQPPGFEVPPPTLDLPGAEAPTYAGQISPLMDAHCTVCHDENGPNGATEGVDLASYDNVVAEFEEALAAIQDGEMPPDGLPPLTPEEVELLRLWAEQGFAP
jgi:hypothetical protein